MIKQRETFGQWLKRIRNQKKLTLRDLEREVGAKYAYLSQIENDMAKPSEMLATNIAQFFNADVEEILFMAREVYKQIDEIKVKYPNVSIKYFRYNKRTGKGEKMSNVRELHHQAMAFADEALKLKQNGEYDKSIEIFRLAFEKEREAVELVSNNLSLEPTRSVLLRSAATIALDCKNLREAERLIAMGLAGNPPCEIAEELRDIKSRLPRKN